MLTDPSILEVAYQCFLEEAPGLLETIERELFDFSDDTKIESVNSMMRAAHTIKGGAANVGLDTINKIAHYLEDVFKALASPDLELDEETRSLLVEGYECLRLPLTAELTQVKIDDAEVLDRATLVFARLDEKLGDYIQAAQDAIPTSAELGVDLVQTIFENVVPTHLDELANALDSGDIEETLHSKIEVFIGFAESLDLPGLGEIASTVTAALDACPGDVATVARIGLEDFQNAHARVLAGDRDRGGEPSQALLALATGAAAASASNASERSAFDLDDLFQDAAPVSDSTLLDPFAAHAEAIADNLNLEEDATAPAASAADNSLDGIWGSPMALEDMAPIDAAAGDAGAVAGDAATTPTEAKTDSASNELDAVFATNLDSELDTVFAAEFATEADAAEASERDAAAAELAASIQASQPAAAPQEAPAVELDADLLAQLEGVVDDSILKIVSPEKKQAKAAAKQSIRVNLEELETLTYLVGDLVIEQNKNILMEEDAQANIAALEEKLAQSKEALSLALGSIESDLPPAIPNAVESITGPAAPSGDRPAIAPDPAASLPSEDSAQILESLQQAMAAIAESSETLQKVKLIAKESRRALQKQQRTSLSMRDELLGSRMAPLENVFNRFPQMVRQLANTHSKPVELEIRGGHILVDKAIEQKLYDPLLHIVRNAFDHGIEMPEARQESGKREPAKIELVAFYQGCQTIVQIRDNGRGIDPQKVSQKLIERGLMSSQEASRMTKSQIIDFLFEPGFSTASKVSDLSGRGVGLDVVRSQIQSLKGAVAVDSTISVGTTFTLQLPLTLNVSKLMICETEGMKYSLLSDTIERIIAPNPADLRLHEGQQVWHWGSGANLQTIPVRCLSDLVSYAGRAKRSGWQSDRDPSQLPQLLLLHRPEGPLALAVDRVLGEQELVIRPLGSTFAPPSYAYGCSILPDGKLSLVVDPITLVSGKSRSHAPAPKVSEVPLELLPEEAELSLETLEKTSEAAPAAPAESQPPVARAIEPELLIVDDSPNARLSLAMSLKKAGYTIQEAEDGLDALEKLKQTNNIGLILCDVDMPNMNGFEFLTAFHKDPTLTKVPVAMLTSHNSKKYRQLATNLGATAYFTKPYRDEEVLPEVSKLLNKA